MLKLVKNRTIGSILMIAGSAIGAGMLALPLKTAAAGFFPSLALFFACFLFMTYTVFILLEANLMSKDSNANLITMAKERLGKPAQAVAWVTFLLLLYSVSAAYMSAGGSLINSLFNNVQGTWAIPMYATMVLFALLFGSIIFFGTHVIDHINKILVLGLIVSFLALIADMVPFIHLEYSSQGDINYLWAAVPVVMLSFTSHVIVPSLRTYLHNDVKHLKLALGIGMTIPLIFYTCWEFLILTLIPSEGPSGLVAIAHGNHPMKAMTEVLQYNLGLTFIATAVGVFSFCALVTSFIAVNLSLRDFLSDGFGIAKDTRGRMIISIMTLLPPLVYAITFPKGFTIAIAYGGVFVAIIYGILPALMVYKGRYEENLKTVYTAPGGKAGLFLVLVGSIMVVLFQVAATMHWLPS